MSLSVALAMPMAMLTHRLFFLPAAATTAARMFVAAAMAAAARQAFDPRDIVVYRNDVRRMHVRRIGRFPVELLEQLLQLGQRLRAGRSRTALFLFFLPVHFDKRNCVEHFVTDFTAGHSGSFHHAFNCKFVPAPHATAGPRLPPLPRHTMHAPGAPVCYTARMHTAPSFENKICAPQMLSARIGSIARPLVFTNGVFDILHRGHASYLAQARALGASLIVAVNSDASVRRLGKGPERPINPLEDRMALVAALEPVSLVTWFEDDTPLALIRLVLPDVLVKGGDWSTENIVGAADVKARGGSVHSIPFIHDRSTTATLRRIRG